MTKYEKSIQAYIKSNKYLRDEKYFKNNVWSMAAYDSWAARGQDGGCGIMGCKSKHYNGHLENKRHVTGKGGRKKWSGFGKNSWMCESVSTSLCNNCIAEIEKQINFTFKRR